MNSNFLSELKRQLTKNGIPSADPINERLPVLFGGKPIIYARKDGEVFFDRNVQQICGADELYHTVARLASVVLEYTDLVEQSPLLKADSLQGDFRLLADFNGAVLAGRKRPENAGYQFVTWNWDYGHTGVTLGHYFEENYLGAKEDFATRSGLIRKEQIFSPEQMVEIYGCITEQLDNCADMTQERWRLLSSISAQIEGSVPTLCGQTEQSMKPELNL